ncbi:MAG: hypothetical protein A2583_00795 [Bdellovibrionales bacterium RIFOXYD1_FULL_53_11]|nr:MAG: hypothetical protein A2583_00795 [Bdellovibrionales bacterium RIFOXYD1_FULL_53_11]
MKYRVLISAPYFIPVIEKYTAFFKDNDIEVVSVPVKERLEEAELLKCIEGIDGAICGDDRFTARVLENAKNLKVISKWGTGIDSIDRVEAKRLGIEVCNTPGAFTNPVSDSVMAYVLAFARQVFTMTENMRKGQWEKAMSISLCECSIGVVGVGNVGRAVLRKAKAFDMKLYGNDMVAIPAEFIAETGVRMVSLDELLEKSDFISLNTDLNPTSFHLIDAPQFLKMKKSAFLINTSRGPVICEPALCDALQNQRIAGAALDVFEVEPLPLASPLLKFSNCFLAPHNSNCSPAAWERVHESTLKNLVTVLKRHRGVRD